MTSTNQSIELISVEPDRWVKQSADIIVEAPVSLTVNGDLWLTFMCTPINLEAMAVGFLYNEGLINTIEEVADVRLCAAGDNVDIWTYHPIEKPSSWQRTSGCTGGVTSVKAKKKGSPVADRPSTNGCLLSPAQVGEQIARLFSEQDLYQKSGGVHTSALSDCEDLFIVAEDIGRHNTLDKIAGRCLIEGIKPKRSLLITTGRISSEMLQKASRIGASVVISRTSPSSLSIELAKERGITLIGYARRDRFKIYSHPGRIILNESIHEDQYVSSIEKTSLT